MMCLKAHATAHPDSGIRLSVVWCYQYWILCWTKWLSSREVRYVGLFLLYIRLRISANFNGFQHPRCALRQSTERAFVSSPNIGC